MNSDVYLYSFRPMRISMRMFGDAQNTWGTGESITIRIFWRMSDWVTETSSP